MLETVGDLWAEHAAGKTIAITTNGIVKNDGNAVMGRGVALQAAEKFPRLPALLGASIRAFGNHVYHFGDYRVITFPTKHHWRDASDLQLIARSCDELLALVSEHKLEGVVLPRPGCQNGRLTWDDVRPVCAAKLDDRFTIIERTGVDNA